MKDKWYIEGESLNRHEAYVIVSDVQDRVIAWTSNSLHENLEEHSDWHRHIMDGDDSECITKDDQANARLIVSAPEMLVALENAYDDINWLLAEGFDTNADECNIAGVRDTIAEIKQAIAKARGKG